MAGEVIGLTQPGQNALLVAMMNMTNTVEVKVESDSMSWRVVANDGTMHHFRVRVEEL